MPDRIVTGTIVLPPNPGETLEQYQARAQEYFDKNASQGVVVELGAAPDPDHS